MSSVEEIIIHFVRENPCIYKKTDPNFKNVQKKTDIWNAIAEHLKNDYNIQDWSADVIEKRWTSLRNQFSREHRKQLKASGSGYDGKREWEFYTQLCFLIPHVSHRPTKTSLTTAVTEQETTHTEEDTYEEQDTHEDESIRDEQEMYVEQGMEEIINESQEMHPSPVIRNPFSKGNDIRCKSRSSMCSSSNSSSQKRTYTTTMPEIDSFAKRKREKNNDLQQELIATDSLLRTTLGSLPASKQHTIPHDITNPFTPGIDKALNLVPERRQTECII